MSSAAVAVKGNVRIRFEGSATLASYKGSFERDERIIAPAAESATIRPRGIVVELTPRHFTQTAQHFLSIAKPVDCSVDEADID